MVLYNMGPEIVSINSTQLVHMHQYLICKITTAPTHNKPTSFLITGSGESIPPEYVQLRLRGVADPLGRQDLLAVIMLRLWHKDVFKSFGSRLGLLGHLGCLGHVAARVLLQYSLRELSMLTVQLMIND